MSRVHKAAALGFARSADAYERGRPEYPETAVEDAAVDGVTVGQAFHWFDGDAALGEIARVLRPGGVLALLWNRRVEDDPVNRAIDDLVDPFRGAVPTHRMEAWRAAFERQTRFGLLDERLFESSQELSADGLEARVGSISFIASLEPGERARVLEGARALAGGGVVWVPYRTEVQMCRRL